MSFSDYVRGKTVAIVGPAPAPYDQSAEIDAHDIVYRCSYGFGWRPGMDASPAEDCWTSGVFTAGTGTRVDMAFYNGAASRQMSAGQLDVVLPDLDWAITKLQVDNPIALTNQRWIGGFPHIGSRAVIANQVTLMLWDLVTYQPADVTVFGADFYTGRTTAEFYDTSYMAAGWEDQYDDPVEVFVEQGFEDQEDQRIIIRAIREERGWPNGDERFLKALYMTADEHRGLMRGEQARHAKLRGRL